PVVGVNTGRLGFLSSFTKEEVFLKLDDIIKGNVNVSRRSVIEIISPGKSMFFPFALNDITISRKETTAMITVDSYIDGEFLNVFWGDGVIISTPTGSTAYSLSCGGPIITPNNNTFVITPIALLNLNVLPLIVNYDVEFRRTVESRLPQSSHSLYSSPLNMETYIEIILREALLQILHIQPKDLRLYETILQKLLCGKDKRN